LGEIDIPGVPPGQYQLQVWDERALSSALEEATREVTISEHSSSLGVLGLKAAPPIAFHHKNKYGQDYEPASPDNPIYVQP
jgi:hypothetical protein